MFDAVMALLISLLIAVLCVITGLAEGWSWPPMVLSALAIVMLLAMVRLFVVT